MADWTAGYTNEVDYTFGYYTELNPTFAKFILTLNGFYLPKFEHACELGFGQGLATNIHAAGSQTNWWANDFNPKQVAFAQELAGASEVSINLCDDSFEEYTLRDDLPKFDYIALHGIWSWISDENREYILEFVRKNLKVGGVLYASYNVFPGWSTFAPARHIMNEHLRSSGLRTGEFSERINSSMKFIEEIIKLDSNFSKASPTFQARFNKLKEHKPNYIAHEYFNENWDPMYFSTINKWFQESKVDFCTSANPLDMVWVLNFTKEQQEFLKKIPDPVLKESVSDFITYRQFRKDYWIKGPRKMQALEWAKSCENLRVIMVENRDDVKLQTSGSLGEAKLSETVYGPVLNALEDYKIKTIKEVSVSAEQEGVSFAQTVEAVKVLVGMGVISPAQDESDIQSSREVSRKLNNHIINKAIGSGDVTFLSSPVTGGAKALGRFQQLFLKPINEGKFDPEDWTAYVWSVLTAQNERLIKDGKTIQTEEDTKEEIMKQAILFEKNRLPVLRALGIVG